MGADRGRFDRATSYISQHFRHVSLTSRYISQVEFLPASFVSQTALSPRRSHFLMDGTAIDDLLNLASARPEAPKLA